MKPFDDAAYTMAAVSAVVALYRTLVKNGALTRDEAVRALLDEAVSRADVFFLSLPHTVSMQVAPAQLAMMLTGARWPATKIEPSAAHFKLSGR